MAATLEVILKARDEITNVLKNTDVQFSKVAISANKLKTSFGTMLTVATAAAIGYGIKNMTSEALRFADGIKKTSEQMQMNTTETQTWDFVMRQAGGTVTDLSSSMQRMQKLAYDASIGNKTAAEAFKALGVGIYDAHGALKLAGPLFADTVRALQNVSNTTERAGMASAIFGKSARELNPILSMTNAELKAQIAQASEYGQVLSEKAVKALDDSGDALANFSMSMKVAKAEIVSNMIPAINDLAAAAAKAAPVIGSILNKIIQGNVIGYKLLAGQSIESIRAVRTVEEATLKGGAEGLNTLMSLRDEYNGKIKTTTAEMEKANAQYETMRLSGTGTAYAEAKALDVYDKAKTEVAQLTEIYDIYQKGLTALVGKSIKTTPTGTGRPTGTGKAEKFNPAGLPSQMNISSAMKDAQEEISAIERVNEWKAQNDQEQIDSAKAMREQTMAAKYELQTSEIMLKEEGYTRELELLQLKQTQELAMYEEGSAAYLAIKQKQTNEIRALDDLQKKTNIQNMREQLNNSVGNLKTVASRWKEFAGVYKAIAIAQATWDTYSAANASYKALAGVGPVGPVLGGIAAGVAIAAGLANVASIASAKFARGGDFITTGPQMILVGDNPGGRERVSVTPESSPNYAGPQGGGHTFIVNDYSGGFVETFRRDLRSGKADKLISDIGFALGIA